MKAAAAAGLLLLLATVAAQADAVRGERVFQRCYSCHEVEDDAPKLPGPHLKGVVGRRAGARADFDYSPAMTAAGRSGLIWTRAALDRYLADPQSVVPGTTMAPPPGLSDPGMRADVIDYLEAAGR